ncbi:site-specific integrase [uncultured Tenacibaculum sp.]|uniref:tyrosine-type recombinase/integrase n=1 Tax=uncultured Tenacibaculum sp. TaxID=174713 RepID=UPI00261ABE3D|nr:site-specific integrase [uncultured Tenacibaculum sp.]
MSNFKKSTSATIFIDYIPAELRQNQDWIIVYYAKIPARNKLKRFRNRVPKISSKKERLKFARKMVVSINNKLENGWSPFYEEKNLNYKSYDQVKDTFLKVQEKEVKDGIKRSVSYRSYLSYLKKLDEFQVTKSRQVKFLIEIDNSFIHDFFDYLYIEKGYSPRTYNNYLQFLSSFFIWAKSKGYIKQNPVESIKPKPEKKKKREILTNDVKSKLKKLRVNNFNYYVLCMCTYYCFIRRTELTKLKVGDVDLSNSSITIIGENSKNKKTDIVTIPNSLKPLLRRHLLKGKNDDFLFSKNKFLPGKTQLAPKKISDEWNKFRKVYNIENKYQWYSLKDTGITDLLNSGIPSLKVRNQARHHDLKMTETYTQRNISSDNTVKNADFNF